MSRVVLVLLAFFALVVPAAANVTFPYATLENYPTVRGIPTEFTFSNLTHSKEYTPDWVVTARAFWKNYPRTNYTGPGAMWKYYFHRVNGSNSDGETEIYLCDEDLANCQSIRLHQSENGAKTEYVILDKDASYSVRNAAGAEQASGTYVHYPARLKAVATGGTGIFDFTETILYEFEIPSALADLTPGSDVPTGNVTVTTERYTSGLFGYFESFVGRTYYFSNLTNATDYELNAYGLFASEYTSSKFLVQNIAASAISGATVTAYKYYDGEAEIVTSGATDGVGLLNLNFDSSGSYYVVISAVGYEPRQIIINNPESAYTITLSAAFQWFESILTGLSIYIIPTESYVEPNEEVYWNLTVVDTTSSIEYFALNLTNVNGTGLTNGTVSGSPAGSLISLNYTPILNDSVIYANITIQRTDQDLLWVVRTYNIIVLNETSTSLTMIATDFKNTFSPTVVALVSLMIIVLLASVHPVFALAGLIIMAVLGLFGWVLPAACIFIFIALVWGGVG